jgi:SAM-dependent methyltransferase
VSPARNSGRATHTPEQVQRSANNRIWAPGRLLRLYAASTELRPVEGVLFSSNAERLSGRVLELGCGAGRLTGHLLELASSVDAMDIATNMVEYCRRRYPAATFNQGDLRESASWGSGPWSAIVAGWALIDVLNDEERGAFLEDAHRLLTPGGMLLFSSHNLAAAAALRGPLGSISARTPVSLAGQLIRLPRSYLNHRRLMRWERIEPDYAILNGAAHEFSLLHYYISRDGQERQLRRHGFELLECLDEAGEPVAAGESGGGCHELHYVALRSEGRLEKGQ